MADRERGMDGVLVVAKEPGYTSHDVVAIVRRLTGTRRAGHGGTLDPFASGVLPVFLGQATRLVEYHMADGKAYRATIRLGARSETDDRDGKIVPGTGPIPTREDVEAALAEFRGPIEQRPPAFSALKVSGRRAYDLAREGIPPELRARSVTIHRMDLVGWDAADPVRPAAVVEVECSAGTYIRSLARDLGDRLGCGAYLGELTRTASGGFSLAGAHSLDEVRAAAEQGPELLAGLLLPIDWALDAIPAAALTAEEVVAAVRGQRFKPERRPEVEPGTVIRFLGPDGSLAGLGRWQGGRLLPEKMLLPLADGIRGAASVVSAPATKAGGTSEEPQREPRLKFVAPISKMVTVGGVAALKPELGRLYVAVGVFDGLHRGHEFLLRELRRAARRAEAGAAVITFDAHPEELIEGLAPPLLCDPDERLVRLAAAGVGVTVIQHFDHALRMTSYEDFVAMIRDRVELAGFVMTPDASFGYERGGTPETLAALGARQGFGVTVVPTFMSNGAQLRSSEIRRRVQDGNLAGARQLLGRPLALTGRMERHSEAGAAETGAPAAGAQVTFDLPVCLPPAGRYRVLLGPAWSVSGGHEPAGVPAVASLGETGFALKWAGGAVRLPAGLVRVVFVDDRAD